MGAQGIFHLLDLHLHAARIDGVVPPAQDAEAALGVELHQVVGDQQVRIDGRVPSGLVEMRTPGKGVYHAEACGPLRRRMAMWDRVSVMP